MEEKKTNYFALLIPVIITVIFEFSLTNYEMGNGTIESYELEDKVLIRVKNYSDENINSLKISISKTIDINSITSNKEISIIAENEISINKRNKIISFSNISPHNKTLIFIPLKDNETIQILNSSILNLNYITETKKPYEEIIISIVAKGFLYFIVMIIVLKYVNKHYKAVQKDVYKLEEKAKEATKEFDKNRLKSDSVVDKLNNDIYDLRKNLRTAQILDNEIISHYKKEIIFWRGFVSKNLDLNRKEKEKLLNKIDEEFKNNSTFKINADERIKSYELLSEIFEQHNKHT